MFSNKFLKNIKLIPLSNNTVGCRIKEITINMKFQLIERVKGNPFYMLQIDKTTNISNDVQLICYIRYSYDNYTHNDILFCKTL